MYITIYKHVQTMSERIQTICKHFAVVLLNLFRQQYSLKVSSGTGIIQKSFYIQASPSLARSHYGLVKS